MPGRFDPAETPVPFSCGSGAARLLCRPRDPSQQGATCVLQKGLPLEEPIGRTVSSGERGPRLLGPWG